MFLDVSCSYSGILRPVHRVPLNLDAPVSQSHTYALINTGVAPTEKVEM